jgi:hypothetical protein
VLCEVCSRDLLSVGTRYARLKVSTEPWYNTLASRWSGACQPKGKQMLVTATDSLETALKKFSNSPLGFVCWRQPQRNNPNKSFYLYSAKDGMSVVYSAFGNKPAPTANIMSFEDDLFFLKRAIASFAMRYYYSSDKTKTFINPEDPDRFIENVEMVYSNLGMDFIRIHCDWICTNSKLNNTIDRWCQRNKDGFAFNHIEFRKLVNYQFSQS